MQINKFTGVIFDFNGTLFWDTKLHNQAWDIFLSGHNLTLSDEDKTKFIHGKTNKEILNIIFNADLDKTFLDKYSMEKEKIYQSLCLKSGLGFAPGAIDFIEFLREGNIDYAIATSSGKGNIDFYLSYLHLEKWFAPNQIIYNDGSIKSKPDPEIFQVAIKRINKNPEDVLIFEDSFAGIEAAEKAGAGKIIIVNSNGDDYGNYNYKVISNFSQIDGSIFNK
jgi:beta-phosphoglucomutase-like phosphatase (HAD superfamily)